MKTYSIPIALFVTSVIGLVAMLLVDDAIGDYLALLLLCLPLVALVRHGFFTPPASR